MATTLDYFTTEGSVPASTLTGLYPRQHGYAFKGYSFDGSGNPTFRYHINDIAISDSAIPAPVEAESEDPGDYQTLSRVITFETSEAAVIYMRALTGDITKDKETSFQTKDLALEIPQMPDHTELIMRPSAAEGTTSELLLKLPLPAGKSRLMLTYDPTP